MSCSSSSACKSGIFLFMFWMFMLVRDKVHSSVGLVCCADIGLLYLVCSGEVLRCCDVVQVAFPVLVSVCSVSGLEFV